CYPNPFSPLRQTLHFSNPLIGETMVLTIYTLTGEEVFTLTLTAAEATADALVWDGRNSSGQMVLNGVYLAVLNVEGKGEVRTKIAVVK
ncbi:MAG: T9SS type A sorting domain-containing protein, partial [candidate division Zixibacteria bacterium]|nr:T9SS type A sorting domain-containing protein [candidate division Zixibacteria bacterium]